MGLLFWKNNKAIDAFAQAVADDLYSYVQPNIARQHVSGRGDMSKKKKAKIEQKFTDIRLQIKRFADSRSLGIYGKARLQKQFNERLQELGYHIDVVNKITENFLLQNA
jgi:hypothetical protein